MLQKSGFYPSKQDLQNCLFNRTPDTECIFYIQKEHPHTKYVK